MDRIQIGDFVDEAQDEHGLLWHVTKAGVEVHGVLGFQVRVGRQQLPVVDLELIRTGSGDKDG